MEVLENKSDGKILASLALLSARWNDDHKSYLDNFVLFLVYSVEVKCQGVATEKEAAAALDAEFGLKLPYAVVRDILKRAAKEKYGSYSGSEFHTNKTSVPKIVAEMQNSRIQSLREQDVLIRKFSEFANSKHSLNWERSVAEGILQDYVEKNGSQLLHQSLSNLQRETESENEGNEFVFFEWVENLLENDLTSFRWLEEMIKGAMLAMAIVLPTQLETTRKFRSTTIWLDTPLILQLLGFLGSEMREYMIEIIDLAQKQNAKIRVFSHVLNESKGVIRAAAGDIYNLEVQAKPGSVLAWFRSQKLSPTEILVLLQGIESKLLSKGIDFSDKPDHNEKNQIDEIKLEKVLQDTVKYTNNSTLKVDLESLSAIHRLRAGYVSDRLEDCRHLFLTNNDKLIRASGIFFSQSDKGWPIAMLDHIVGSLIWIKSPLSIPDLPKKRIIADALVSTHPSLNLWQNFVKEVDNLRNQQKISEEELLLMREGPEAEKVLMEVTAGGMYALNSETTLMIRDRIKDEILQPARESLLKSSSQVASLSAEKAELEDKLSKSLDVIEKEKTRTIDKISRRSKIVKWSLKTLFIFIIGAAVTRAIFGFSQIGLVKNLQNWSYSIVGLVGIIFLLKGNLIDFADWCGEFIHKRQLQKAMKRFE